jgi:tRNA A-37 threonylcarbamoyl transferase component Bud32
MHDVKNTARALVRIGYDGRVHKTFRGHLAKERFENEVRVLKYLETKGCAFVPTLLESDPECMKIVTTNCGKVIEHISEDRMKEIYAELASYGVRHEDAFMRNITYRASDGRLCVIDFEFATLLDDPASGLTPSAANDASSDSRPPVAHPSPPQPGA